jgi:hypothetical protein
LCVVIVITAYTCAYVIGPGQSVVVESQPDAIGLKVGIIYDAIPESHEFHYQRFVCKNDSVLNISEVDFEDVSWYGGKQHPTTSTTSHYIPLFSADCVYIYVFSIIV